MQAAARTPASLGSIVALAPPSRDVPVGVTDAQGGVCPTAMLLLRPHATDPASTAAPRSPAPVTSGT